MEKEPDNPFRIVTPLPQHDYVPNMEHIIQNEQDFLPRMVAIHESLDGRTLSEIGVNDEKTVSVRGINGHIVAVSKNTTHTDNGLFTVLTQIHIQVDPHDESISYKSTVQTGFGEDVKEQPIDPDEALSSSPYDRLNLGLFITTTEQMLDREKKRNEERTVFDLELERFLREQRRRG